MRRTLTALALLLTMLVLGQEAAAQVGKPTFYYQKYKQYEIASAISDNGKWALVYGASNEQKTNGYSYLVNVETKDEIVIRTKDDPETGTMGKYEVSDVTDDGNIVVGSFGGTFTGDGYYTGKPGYWNKTTMTWTALPLPDGAASAVVSSVTPDGHYAVGTSESDTSNPWTSVSQGVMWDLTADTIVALPGKPVMEMDTNEKGVAYPQQEAFTQITADGRYIAIYGNQSYAPISYLYDREQGTYIKFGTRDTGTGYPTDYLQMEGGIVLSPNGKWAAGTIRTDEDELFPLLYNIETKTYTYFNTVEENDLAVNMVDDSGDLFASSPSTNPVREWQVMVGNVWYPFSQILEQRYGITYSDYTGYDNTGTPWCGSADGTVICSMVSPQGESWIATLPESVSAACEGIDLLKDYTPSPADGAQFHWMETLTLTFANDITAIGDAKAAVLKDKDGKTVRNSMAFYVSPTSNKQLVVTFRATALNEGEQYSVVIPAGNIALAKNTSKVNSDITLHYIGRADVPVEITSVFPVDNAEIARIDNSGNPIYLTPDVKVRVTKNASASLIQVDGESEKTISALSVVASNDNSMVALVPAATQYLYSGAEYKVVLAAGSLTDLSGSDATDSEDNTRNKEYTIHYTGTYERQISTDDADLFFDDFDDVATSLKNFMRYEGDHLTPTSDMQELTFDADNQPWNFTIRESNSSTNYYAASHSMYDPAGQSDDWLIIPQLTIPDAYTNLLFKAQSYLEDKHDTLRVVVWPQDENISYFSDDRIAKMKAGGDVYTYALNIGDTEDGLDGEFTDYTLSLAKYAGQKVYIAFWNHNTDQSMMFLDSVMVRRNLKYLMAINSAASVVKKTEQTISGTITVNADNEVYHSVTLTLKDADGQTVDTYTQSGLSLKKGDKQSFTFAKPLPLTIGVSNAYSIKVQLDDYTDEVKSSIKDLTFEPVKRVVLEEMTGFTCQYCPEGLVTIEHLKKLYGDQFIPVSIHTYTGDSYGTGLYGYTSYLGLTTAPSAIIQRDGNISSPLAQNDDGDYTFNSEGGYLWSDKVAAELNKPADFELSVPSIVHNETTNKLDLTLSLRAALNLKNQYVNVFAVAMEDSIVYTQENALRESDDPIFGEWGKGGIYAYAQVPNVAEDDVVRSYWGSSFSGSNAGFPQAFEAGQEYSVDLSLSYPDQIFVKNNGKIVFMAFDGNTNALVNAVLVKMADIRTSTGISDTQAATADIKVSAAHGMVTVKAAAQVSVSLYTPAGQLLGQASGHPEACVKVAGYRGPVIVKAVSGQTVTAQKVILE